jgi:16S rRNA (guanine527-N7)-methyltransferase
MHPERIAELLQPFLEPIVGDSGPGGARTVLLPDQLLHISTYIDLLLRWNARVNLTSVRQPEQIVSRHFGESLFTARHLFPNAGVHVIGAESPEPRLPKEKAPGPHVIDIGSGAGFPGIPIKIWNPQVKLTLIESNQKKATFLREVARALTLTNINVFPGRASDFRNDPSIEINPQQITPQPITPWRDAVTLRAVERFETILPEAIRLTGPSARLAILIGQSQLKQLHSADPSIEWSDPVKLPLSSNRLLSIGSKESREST